MRQPVSTRTDMGGSRLLLHAIAALLAGPGLAAAADLPGQARFRIEQPSQSLAGSLRSIARQTGASVLFDPGMVSGRVAPRVSGTLSAAEAISQALDGSGLTVEVMKDGAVVVKPPPAPATTPPPPTSMLRSALLEPEPGPPARQLLAASGDVADQSRDTEALKKIEITGSRLKRVAAEGPVPVNVYSKEDLERSGQPTLERFLAGLNEASVSQGEGTFGPLSGQGSVQLRGLPLGSTLVLINGRRVQAVGSSSANFFNINLIPLAAVERVEVLPVGSSAVYGGDALAGVVNVILKKSIDGLSLDARVASGRGIGDGSISLATGSRGESGSLLVVGSYSKSTPLTMAERAFFSDADYRRFGGPDARSRSCMPGTVSSATDDNLPGLTSTFAGIPSKADQPLGIEDFAATAGQANLCNSLASGSGYALVYGAESAGLHAAVDRWLSDSWSAFGELTFADDKVVAEQGGLQLNNVLVPAANPFNPFGVDVRVTTRLGLRNGTEGLRRDTRFARAVAGVRGELGSGWDLEASISTSRDDGRRLQLNNAVNAAARTAALAATTAEAALNPFATGLAAQPDVLGAIWSDAVRNSKGAKHQVAAFLRGEVFRLPAGPVEMIAGVEHGRDRYETAAAGSASSRDSRTASAAYGELRVPLARGGVQGARSWELATLTLAGRHDRYSDFGSASTHQAGVELRPTRSTLLRAAAATSFKPPTLLQTSVDDIRLTTDIFGLVDPARGGAPIAGGEVLRTTNPDLRPEEGRTWSLGALWEPVSMPGSRFGLTAWNVKIDRLIALLWPQVTLDNEALFPGFVTRGPSVDGTPGPVTRVLYAEANFGGVETAGVDLEAAYAWRGAGGRWNLAATATRATRYDVDIAPGAATENRLGRRALDYWAPKWKGRLSLGFDAGVWGLGLNSRYLGGYRDAGASARRLGDYWIHDLFGTLDLKKLGLDLNGAAAASVSLSVTNLGDRLPQFVATAPYYDITQADWRGRYAGLRLSVDW